MRPLSPPLSVRQCLLFLKVFVKGRLAPWIKPKWYFSSSLSVDFEGKFHGASSSLGPLLRPLPCEETHFLRVPSRKDKVQQEGTPWSSYGTLERELVAIDFWELTFFFRAKRSELVATISGHGKGCQEGFLMVPLNPNLKPFWCLVECCPVHSSFRVSQKNVSSDSGI